MPSSSLSRWTADRMHGLHEIDVQCATSSAATPANPYLVEENVRGFILLLSAHFQGYCRDLYTESALIVASKIRPTLRVLVQEQFTANRKLDHGNPSIDNLKRDFSRFGLSLRMATHDPTNNARLAHLSELNEWRNISAHHGTVPAAGLPALPTIQGWKNSCNGLATSLDDIMYNHHEEFSKDSPGPHEKGGDDAMAKQERPGLFVSFNLGDSVRIKHYGGKLGKIVENRGALGPDGALVYRVKVNRKPNISYIELLGSQLEAVSRGQKKPIVGLGKNRKSS
jgi:hypothetical protein